MKSRPNRDCRSGSRDGLTLIEVVAGAVLAGTLLVLVIRSSSAHLQQLKLADRKTVAATAVDQFLSEWSRNQFAQADIARALKASGCVLHDSGSTTPASGVGLSFAIRQVSVFANARYEIVTVSAINGSVDASSTVDCWVEVLRPLSERREP